jgi:hypothetical protein
VSHSRIRARCVTRSKAKDLGCEWFGVAPMASWQHQHALFGPRTTTPRGSLAARWLPHGEPLPTINMDSAVLEKLASPQRRPQQAVEEPGRGLAIGTVSQAIVFPECDFGNAENATIHASSWPAIGWSWGILSDDSGRALNGLASAPCHLRRPHFV